MEKYPHHVEATINEKSLLKKLSAGRHPVAITDPNVMQYLAEQEGIDNIEFVENITKKELVIAFRDSVENRKRLQQLNRILTLDKAKPKE